MRGLKYIQLEQKAPAVAKTLKKSLGKYFSGLHRRLRYSLRDGDWYADGHCVPEALVLKPGSQEFYWEGDI